MTSGNRSMSRSPTTMTTAVERLGDIADCILAHNRPIHVRCDDSVTCVIDGEELPIRRSRGYAPNRVHLPTECLADAGRRRAVQGRLRTGTHAHAFLSHHLGDLDYFEATRQFERDIGFTSNSFRSSPSDRTRFAPRLRVDPLRARAWRLARLRAVAVQHHHAHWRVVWPRTELDEPVIGVTFDGTGFGLEYDRRFGEVSFWWVIITAFPRRVPICEKTLNAWGRQSSAKSRGGWRRPI